MVLGYSPFYNGPISVGRAENAARVMPFKALEVGDRFRWAYHDPDSQEYSPAGSKSPLMVKVDKYHYRHVEGGDQKGRKWRSGAMTGTLPEVA
jgi:hypothetical protein